MAHHLLCQSFPNRGYAPRLMSALLMSACVFIFGLTNLHAEDGDKDEHRHPKSDSRPEPQRPEPQRPQPQRPAPERPAPHPAPPPAHINPPPQSRFEPPPAQRPAPQHFVHHEDERNGGEPRPYGDDNHPHPVMTFNRPSGPPPHDRPPSDWRAHRGDWHQLGEGWRPPAVYMMFQNNYRFWEPPPPLQMRYFGPPLYVNGVNFMPGCSSRARQAWDGGGWWHESTTEVCFADYQFPEPAGTYRDRQDCVVSVGYRYIGDVWWRRQVTRTCYYFAG